jgi:hypothetical protein
MSSLLKNLVDKKLSKATEEDLRAEYQRGKWEDYREGERRAVEGKDEMIAWLNGELYRKNMKLEFSEELMRTRLNLGPAELAMWGQIITEFNTPRYKSLRNKHLSNEEIKALDVDRVRKLLEAVMFLKDSPIETIEKRFREMKSAADQMARVITSQLEDLKLLNEADPGVSDDNPGTPV